MISDKTIIKRIGFIVALTAFTGTALAGITDIARDAKNGDESAQRQLSNRYVSGSEVVKDDLLAEQWLLRSDPNRSASSGGDALRKLQEKRDKSGEKKRRARGKNRKCFCNCSCAHRFGFASSHADKREEFPSEKRQKCVAGSSQRGKAGCSRG